MNHTERWCRKFVAEDGPCLTLATVDLPHGYPGERPGAWETLAHEDVILSAAGLDGVRFNGTKGWHPDDLAAAIRRAHAKRKVVMVDVVSRLRIRDARDEPVFFSPGGVLTVGVPPEPRERLAFNRPLHLSLLEPSQEVLIRDGRVRGFIVGRDLEFGRVTIRIDWTDTGETLAFRDPPVNLPGFPGFVWTLAKEDREIISLAVREEVDLLAVSFVETPQQAAAAARAARAVASRDDALPTISLKMETKRGAMCLPEILAELVTYAGGVVVEVALGDLGLDVPLAELGEVVDHCFQVGRDAAVPVGVATGLLGSMQMHPYPSRAERLAVHAMLKSGAVFLLLADETANDGTYPGKAIEALAALVRSARARTEERRTI